MKNNHFNSGSPDPVSTFKPAVHYLIFIIRIRICDFHSSYIVLVSKPTLEGCNGKYTC